MQGNYSVWNDARIAQLTTLWVGGDSATVIAATMAMTRCAILGKVHRLKLARRKTLASVAKGPRAFVPRSLRPPKEITTPGASVSAITHSYIGKPKPPRVRELTKDQLRAQLTQAVINTGGVR